MPTKIETEVGILCRSEDEWYCNATELCAEREGYRLALVEFVRAYANVGLPSGADDAVQVATFKAWLRAVRVLGLTADGVRALPAEAPC